MKTFLQKYQPTTFNEFEQTTTVQILKDMLTMDYANILLVGNAGTGKTVYIHAAIHEYYAIKNITNYQHNVLQITPLEEQGIQFYRNNIKTFCQTINPYKKIIIIDNMDLLCDQLQHIIRTYMDKYSKQVFFIASCQNIHNIIDSVQSRLLSIPIQPLQPSNVVNIINTVIHKEQLPIIDKDTIITLISKIYNNNIKMIINVLEKMHLTQLPISIDNVFDICLTINVSQYETYINHMRNNALHLSIQVLYSMFWNGYSILDILHSFFSFIKYTEILTEKEKYVIIPHICKYITLFHDGHEDELELALFTNDIIPLLCA